MQKGIPVKEIVKQVLEEYEKNYLYFSNMPKSQIIDIIMALEIVAVN